MKNKGGVGLLQISYLTYINQVIILQCFLPYYTLPKKGLSFPFSLGKKIIYLETQLKGEITDLFSKLTGHPCSHRQSRNKMMNTFIIVNIAP